MLSRTMRLESLFYPKDWQTLSQEDLDLGTGNPVLVDGYVLQIGKTDIAYLLRQDGSAARRARSHRCRCAAATRTGARRAGLGGLRAMPERRDGGQDLEHGPAPEAALGRQRWRRNGPIVAGGLVWTIGGGAVRGLNPTNGHEVASIPFGAGANHFPTPSVGDGLLLVAGVNRVFAFMGPAGLPPAPPPA